MAGAPPELVLLGWDMRQRAILTIREHTMSTAKHEIEQLLKKLPDDCSLEDVQYHLYVLEKVRRGLDEARQQGTISQEEVEARLQQWLTE